ncbi:PhoPQ-activated pathogenicity-related family protein [Bacteroidota bacterium]
MKNHQNIFISLFLAIILLLVQCQPRKDQTPTEPGINETLIDKYVKSPDENFQYEVIHQAKNDGYTYYVLRMISQKWLTVNEVDEPIWWHWVKIVVPDTIHHDTGLMWIGGGDKEDELPEKAGAILVQSALLTHSITAEIHNIPNQDLNFIGDDYGPREEDELIAYGWRQFLEKGATDDDAIWLARFPMTKAVVRAMDAVSDVAKNEHQHNLEHYVVAGGSKRGWTTWITGAVDDRVVAIVPIVIDLLNIVPSFSHHWQAYGFWAPAVGNYVEEGIMDWMGSREFSRLLEITGPYSYIDRYDMPKLLISAGSDEFFLPDSWQYYWGDLIGEKHVRYVPNSGHSLRETDAVETLIAFYSEILEDKVRPDYQWNISDQTIHVETDMENPPAEVKLWYAENKETRDFRLDIIGQTWKDSTLIVSPDGKYAVNLPVPEEGWKAYFVELTYDGVTPLPMKLTTGVKVLPETLPFEPFQSPDPKGEKISN